MNDHRNIPSDLPFIATLADLEGRDATRAALLEVPSPMVAGVWWIVHQRMALDDLGELCRGLELAIHGLGCALEGEAGAEDLPFGLEQASRAMTRLFSEAGQLRHALSRVVEAEEGEKGEDGDGEGGPVRH